MFSRLYRGLSSKAMPAGLDGLIITPSAVRRLADIREGKAAGVPSMAGFVRLRVGVEGGGCSGFSYQYKLETSDPVEDDIVFEKDGVEVVVDSTSLDLIRGATVDYSEDMMRAAFQIVNNPNAEGGCGCGVSFRPKEVQ